MIMIVEMEQTKEKTANINPVLLTNLLVETSNVFEINTNVMAKMTVVTIQMKLVVVS